MSNRNETRDGDANHGPISGAPGVQEKRRGTLFSVIAVLAVSAGALAACDKTPTSPPVPNVEPVQIESDAATGPVGSTSVPTADSVLPPGNTTKADPTLGRSNNAMSAAQESTAMPMPGQNNDHSAALGPAKRASAP